MRPWHVFWLRACNGDRFAVKHVKSSLMACTVWLLARQAPSISSQTGSRSAEQGERVRLEVLASGYPEIQYQWLLNDVEIHGEIGSNLSLPSFDQERDGGTYVCKVFNRAGYVNSSVQLSPSVGSVDGVVAILPRVWCRRCGVCGCRGCPRLLSHAHVGAHPLLRQAKSRPMVISQRSFQPEFFVHPVSQEVSLGEALVLTAEASSLPAPSYQWMRDGTAIQGQTHAELRVAHFTPASAGVYTCRAFNSQGTAESFGAIVTGECASRVVPDKLRLR